MTFAQNRTGSIIEIQTLLGLALAASGEEAGAADALAGALTLACLQGYVRVFADEGTPMAALLGRLVAAQKTEQAAARGVSMAYLARLFRAFGQEPAMPDSGQDAVAAVPGLVERLTAREVEILVCWRRACPTRGSPNSWWSAWTRSRNTSATCWASSARLTAPRPSPGPASSASFPSALPAADLGGHCRAAARLSGTIVPAGW